MLKQFSAEGLQSAWRAIRQMIRCEVGAMKVKTRTENNNVVVVVNIAVNLLS